MVLTRKVLKAAKERNSVPVVKSLERAIVDIDSKLEKYFDGIHPVHCTLGRDISLEQANFLAELYSKSTDYYPGVEERGKPLGYTLVFKTRYSR
ncbi:hypothetical protein GOV11_02680 [Candidatus Woesearchaeota archaeon]|nr:hypothetical protein [Candidatus Woesearchaeota archaeon]